MDIEVEDDWNPSNNLHSILNKKVVVFTDQQIENNIEKQLENEANFHNDNQDINLEDFDTTNSMFDSDFLKQEMKNQINNKYIFYDPIEDEENERWVTKNMRQGQRAKNNEVLSCGNCFTQVCYQFQKHQIYENQFRAIKAFNCEIDSQQIIKPVEDEVKKKGKIFFAAKCKSCDTTLAGYDPSSKEYHFFDAINCVN